jgi:hypothetical protein
MTTCHPSLVQTRALAIAISTLTVDFRCCEGFRMDVLEYWSPAIDWSHFAQGAVSDPMWRSFKDLILLCHCVEHWRETRRSLRLTRPPQPFYTPETRYARKKRQDEWKRPIMDCETHMHRAAYLADEKIAGMSYLITPADEGKPDWKLWFAAALSIGRSLGHDHARYKSIAFDTFTPEAPRRNRLVFRYRLEGAAYASDIERSRKLPVLDRLESADRPKCAYQPR